MPGLVLGLKLNFAKGKRSFSNMYFNQKVENLCTVVENPSPEGKNIHHRVRIFFIEKQKKQKTQVAKILIEQKIRLWQKKILRRNFLKNVVVVVTPFLLRRRWRRSRQRRVDA